MTRTPWPWLLAALVLLWPPRPAPAQVAVSEASTVTTLLARGATLRSAGRLDDAVTVFQAAVAQDSSHAPAWVELAVTYAWQSRLPQARAAYHRALAHDPQSVPARLGLARIAAWQGKLRQADSAFAELMTVPGARLEALLGRAFVAAARLDYTAAHRHVTAALALDPTNAEALAMQRRLQREGRLDVRAAVGRPVGVANRASGTVAAAYRVDPATRLTVAFRWEVLEALQAVPTTAPTTWRHSASVGIAHQLGGGFRAGLSYEMATAAIGWGHYVGLDVAARVRHGLVVSAGVRPGHTPAGRELLSWIGAGLSPTPGISLGVTGFRGADARGGRAVSVMASAAAERTGTGVARLWVTRGWVNGRSFDLQGVALEVNLHARTAVTLGATRIGGSPSSGQVLVGLRVLR